MVETTARFEGRDDESLLSDRLNTPISTGELERRWGCLRAVMAENDLDVLIAQGVSGHLSGYIRYLADAPAYAGMPTTVVFPRSEAMTIVAHGPFGGQQTLAHDGDTWRGVGQILTYPYFPSVHYTQAEQLRLIAAALGPYARSAIGIVGTFQAGIVSRGGLPDLLRDASWREATDVVDRIKMVKSEEEQALIRRTAEIQDAAMEAAFAAVEPGKRELEMMAVAEAELRRQGGEDGVFLAASGPPGEAAAIAPPHLQSRILQEGDVLSLLVEGNGPGGYYTELGRSCVIGKAPQEAVEDFELAIDARRHTLERLLPGTPCSEVWQDYNEHLRAQGRPAEDRLHCHGQGYDLVERPLIRGDEPLKVVEGLNVACHPSWSRNGWFTWICDNYLVGPAGPGERLHRFPEKIVEL